MNFFKGRKQIVSLGDEVRDVISGFQGIAVARTDWIHGCIRINVQPAVDSEGKLPESVSFDEPQLEVITAAQVGENKKAIKDPGGPITRGMNQGKNIKR